MSDHAFFGLEQQRRLLSDELLGRIAELPRRCGVGEPDDSVAVDVQDHVGRAFDQSVIACVLAIAEEALAPSRVRHVDDLDDTLSRLGVADR